MKKKYLLLVSLVVTISYLGWRIDCLLTAQYTLMENLLIVLLLGVELISYTMTYYDLWCSLQDNHFNKPMLAPYDFPDVDVFICVQEESIHKIRQVINGCQHMDYSDPTKVHIYICDAHANEKLAQLAETMKISYLSPDASCSSKPQFLNSIAKKSHSPYIVFFDGHTIPIHDFLLATIPYFFYDTQASNKTTPHKPMGFVQTPIHYYNRDLFQFNLFTENARPNEQDFYSQYLQPCTNHANASLLTLTNTIISRAALESIGGFHPDATSCEIATGIALQTNGYPSYTLKEPHTNSFITLDMNTFFIDLGHKARETLGVLRHIRKYRKGKLRFKQYLAYMSTKCYWYIPFRSLLLLVLPILFVLMSIDFLHCTSQLFMLLALPHIFLYFICLSTLYGKYRSIRSSHIYETILALPLLATYFFKTKKHRFKIYLFIHSFILAFSLYCVSKCMMQFFMTPTIISLLLGIWFILNIYHLVMSLFFMLGRKTLRSNERFQLSLPVTLMGENWSMEGMTHDLSEGGLSFQFDTPQYIPPTDLLTILLSDEQKRYFSRLQGEIVHVREEAGIWYYSVAFKDLQMEQANSLYQILYDRIPPFTARKTGLLSFYNELQNILSKRRASRSPSHRKLPRIKIKRKFYSLEGEPFLIEEFNYEYILVTNRKNKYADNLILRDAEHLQITFQCTLEKLVYQSDSKKIVFALYKLENAKNYMSDNAFQDMLSTWAVSAREDFDKQIKTQRAYQKHKTHSDLRQ